MLILWTQRCLNRNRSINSSINSSCCNNNNNNNNNNNIWSVTPVTQDCCGWCPQCDCCSSQGVEGSGGGLEEQSGSGEGSGSGEDSTEDKPSPPPVIKLLTKLLKNLFYIFS